MATDSANFENDAGDAEFAAFIVDDETVESLKPVALEHGWDLNNIQQGGIANAVRTLALTASPELLIVDLSESENPREDIAALADVCEENTMLIALGEVNDVHLYRDMLASGVFDYLVKPISSDMLREAISEAKETAKVIEGQPQARAELDEGEITIVVGSRGGIGTSTLAVDLAWTIANQYDQRVALVDLDLQFGAAGLAFDLEPGGGLREAMENPGRIDSLFIDRAVVKESDNLSILSAEAPLTDILRPKKEAVNSLIDEMKDNFAHVIIDCPRHMLSYLADELARAERIIVVVDLSLTSVRDTIRICSYIKDCAPSLNVEIAVNRPDADGHDLISKRDFEGAIERRIDWTIPSDTKAVGNATKTGKAVSEAAKNSKFAAVVRDMAHEIVGDEEVEEKGSKSSIWKIFKRSG